MRFLSRLFSHFAGFIRRSSVRFDEVPQREEVLSRFIFTRSHFNQPQNRVKPDAFLPSKSPVETSIFRGVGLANDAIQQAGNIVGQQSGRRLKAWGDVPAGVIYDVGLSINPDNVPERHAAVTGWPDHKDEQLALAQDIAEASTLRLP
jgi:hypothetical protein